MELPPFSLHEWLEQHENPKVDLAGSTGPLWELRDLLALGEGGPGLDGVLLSYAPTAGRRALRTVIAEHHGVDPDWVIVTNGGSEAFVILLSVLAREGANIVLPFPAYPAFSGIARILHLMERHYRLSRDHRFRADIEEIRGAIDSETVLAVANTPQNPTGATLSREDAIVLAHGLKEKGIPLLVDEVFHPIYYSQANPSAADIDNVIVIGDLSKALSLPGARTGWIIDADPVRRESLLRARSYLSLGGSPVLEAVALHAMLNRAAILKRATDVATANRASLASFMDRTSDILQWVQPDAGMLAFPWFLDERDSRAYCQALAAQGVLVAPGDCFGTPSHMRIGFGSQVEGIAGALEIMERQLRAE